MYRQARSRIVIRRRFNAYWVKSEMRLHVIVINYDPNSTTSNPNANLLNSRKGYLH